MFSVTLRVTPWHWTTVIRNVCFMFQFEKSSWQCKHITDSIFSGFIVSGNCDVLSPTTRGFLLHNKIEVMCDSRMPVEYFLSLVRCIARVDLSIGSCSGWLGWSVYKLDDERVLVVSHFLASRSRTGWSCQIVYIVVMSCIVPDSWPWDIMFTYSFFTVAWRFL